MLHYRADIDGLRAIAVLLVIFYHLDLAAKGGFIGVDVFFVISGYLITSIILKDLKNNNFSIQEFYLRRIRRIMPALFAVMFATLIAGYVFFLPGEFEEYGKSLAATSLFGSNILFWRIEGYFNSSVYLKPLLHTWSLGVEEQFYIFFPIYMIIIYRYARPYLFPLTLAGAAISMAISIWGLQQGQDIAVFYLLPTRAWELAIGAFLAFGHLKPIQKSTPASIVSLLGLGMIIYSGFFFSAKTSFPGLNALLPTLGTALIIWAGMERKDKWGLNAIIGHPVLAYLGRTSYSLYLWHWPIIVFGMYYLIEWPSLTQKLIMLSLSLVVAILSYHFIEQPFKRMKISGQLFQKWAFPVTAILSLSFLAIGIIIAKSDGMEERFPEDIVALTKTKVGLEWKNANIENFLDQNVVIGDDRQTDYTFLIWGDSHATAGAPAIHIAAKDKNQKGVLMTKAGCLSSSKNDPDLLKPLCVESNQKVLNYLEQTPSIQTIFLIARWHAYPRWWSPDRSEENMNKHCKNLQGHLQETVQSLKDRNLNVIIMHQVPKVPVGSVPSALARMRILNYNIDLRPTLAEHNDRYKPTYDMIESIGSEFKVHIVDPAETLCSEKLCEIQKNEQVWYHDGNHLSKDGAKQLTPLFKNVF